MARKSRIYALTQSCKGFSGRARKSDALKQFTDLWGKESFLNSSSKWDCILYLLEVPNWGKTDEKPVKTSYYIGFFWFTFSDNKMIHTCKKVQTIQKCLPQNMMVFSNIAAYSLMHTLIIFLVCIISTKWYILFLSYFIMSMAAVCVCVSKYKIFLFKGHVIYLLY